MIIGSDKQGDSAREFKHKHLPHISTLGSTAAPNPAARGFASGLRYPLALALTLARPFRPGGKESVVVSAAATSLDALRISMEYCTELANSLPPPIPCNELSGHCV